MAARVTGTGVLGMKQLGARLKEADPTLKKELRSNFRDLAGPLVRTAQEAVGGMPSQHDGTLRGELAATVTSGTQITKSGIQVSVVSYGSRMPPQKQNLNGYTDSDRGWMHPVFGSGTAEILAHMAAAVQPRKGKMKKGTRAHGRNWAWVRQYGKPRWFEGSLADKGRDARRAAQAAMDATKRKLGG